MLPTLTPTADLRLRSIARARTALLDGGPRLSDEQNWITRSWQRCLSAGQQPHQSVSFDVIPAQALRRIEEANHTLLLAARPALAKLGRAIANTRYFAILTNAQGIVVDVNGPVDRSDARAQAIARVGVDLSERNVGTTAIGAALAELHPVWLHRGEHFFDDNSCYSCAGAPLFGPDGECVGMLDVTGIDVDERPELQHLVAQSARSIENALTLGRAHSLLVRLNWPGRVLGDETDGLICLDGDGYVTGANQTARQMLTQLDMQSAAPSAGPLHSSDLFAMPYQMFFDAAGRDAYGQPAPLDVPLWSGLRLQAISQNRQQAASGGEYHSLKDVETALIHKAVMQARGNVMQAAKELGISRATVYRKIGAKKSL
jgi:transcriptional regulator of acetoin/glycerol metabolism